jgi:hypothetical protein
MGTQIFSLVRKSQIRKFIGSFRYRKSANFWEVRVRKKQIRNFWGLINKSQIFKGWNASFNKLLISVRTNPHITKFSEGLLI